MRTILWVGLVLLATAGCRDSATSPSVPEGMAEMTVDQIMYGLQHTITRVGIRQGLLFGDTAYLQQGGSKIDLVGVRLTFYDENGRESGNLTSRTGIYELRAGSMVAEGDVVLRTQGDQGERVLETQKLHFDVHGDRLWSDEPVVLREGTQVVHGTSFNSDGRFQNVRVTRAQTSGTPNRPADGGVTF